MFDKNANKCCAYCTHASDFYEQMVLCDKNGPVACDGLCRKFEYDPLRRTPVRPRTSPKKINEEDLLIK